MSQGYLKKKLLRIQVGFLLSEGPGNSRQIPIFFPQRVQVDDDLYLESLAGDLVLTRTKEGILVQGSVDASHKRACDRCLESFTRSIDVELAELFAYPPDAAKSVFSIDGNGEINLAPLLREEVLIEESYRAICREGCRGLSAETGQNLNSENDALAEYPLRDDVSAIDPRLAVLKTLLK